MEYIKRRFSNDPDTSKQFLKILSNSSLVQIMFVLLLLLVFPSLY